MLKDIKLKLDRFLTSGKDYPLLVGFVAGLYPFLFFYSNNYASVNSFKHLWFYLGVFVGTSVVLVTVIYALFSSITRLKPYRKHLLFVFLLFAVAALLSLAMYLRFRKKLLLAGLILLCLLSFKLYNYYKHILVLISFMVVMPLVKCLINIYEDIRVTTWTSQPDDIVNVRFKHKPNIYMIQPDGYVAEQAMLKEPYNYNNKFYGWLKNSGFTVYDNFRSNYPASLTSNASIFAMKHHYFNDFIFPSLEMPRARETILKNDAVQILKNNGYTTCFITEDEYFQQNLAPGIYDHYNINSNDIPLLSKGELKRDVYKDLQTAMRTTGTGPKFFFLEKVLPHHIHFIEQENQIEAERKEYIGKVDEVNGWLKKTIAMINAQDKDAVIIILADHGGWVGMTHNNEYYGTKKPSLVYSTFSALAAIQWNKLPHSEFDKGLVSNVNVFRVVFSILSENKSYIKLMQDNSSYHIRYENGFSGSVYQLIDNDGKVVYKEHKD